MMTGRILQSGRRQLHTIISREIIKPSSPTPCHLRTYNLSKLDQHFLPIYMPLLLLYPNNQNISLTPQDKARAMKKALSQSLTRYYPFAGRLYTPTTPYIDCNDEGVVFVEAKHDSQLDKFQHMTEEDESVGQLFADGMVWQISPHSPNLVGVQLNHFACGGIAVAVSMSHRIGDASTLCSYVNHWASVTRYGSLDHKEVLPFNPHFIQSPATPIFLGRDLSYVKPKCANRVTKKFVFPNSRLTDLKNIVLASAEGRSTLSINNPTRFEVLTSLLYKTVLTARSSSRSSKPSFLLIPMNLRRKIATKLPQTTVGNIIAGMLVTTRHTSATSLTAVISDIKKEKMELEQIQSLQHIESITSRLEIEDLEIVPNISFRCSSLCGFPYNKVDFGWGKPTFASISFRSSDDIGSVLTDTLKGDGIEARLTLETQDMKIFQNDKEMLLYTKN